MPDRDPAFRMFRNEKGEIKKKAPVMNPTGPDDIHSERGVAQ
jgi:hypothetical protein